MAASNPNTLWAQRMSSFQIKQADLNRLVMNYLITEGYQEAAQRFKAESSLEPSSLGDSIDDRVRIRNAVRSGQVKYAMDLANRLYPQLFETNNYMYFHMQQLRLIELIREQKVEQALDFAQSKESGLSEVHSDNIREMQRALALLAFDKPEESPFGDLMKPAYRLQVAGELNNAILKYEGGEVVQPKMMFLIKLILWAQDRLEMEGISDYRRIDLETPDFEDEIKRAFQDG
ncbi:GL11425 [Drosophila persimilis]|uniref:GL11425 n=1 Tax=Drosophila persimilis TaxID=7234 RepID=B4GAR1_DROPE|nr:glucose-induced degradation protein 8-A homolog [Drosophila persimilis]XP_026842315.1 glucose-induced degradation protein 8-A homolog [Drosophila persimilis]EDW32013.1 GL11425 [Drosophila persimilis]